MNAHNGAVAAAINSKDFSIGAILIDAGRLKPEGAEAILRKQRETGARFGDVALELGLLTADDIQFALSRQFDYPFLQKGNSKVGEEVIAAYQPFSPQVEALRALRTQLVLRWFGTRSVKKSLAIVSPGAREGRSWLAANLAVVFSQLGEKTLLIDGDLRGPRLHRLFGMEGQTGLSTILSGRSGMEAIQKVPSLVALSVLPAGPIPPNPQELLGRPALDELLTAAARDFDVILIDTAPGKAYADSQGLAMRAGTALLVATRDASSLNDVGAYADALRQAGVGLIGTVLNEI